MRSNSQHRSVSVTAVMPTHNPKPACLRLVVEGLRNQTLPPSDWELVVVDNRSDERLEAIFDASWHPHARVVREEVLGLTFARLRGFGEARGDLIVMVDDDNILEPGYLEAAVRIAQEQPLMGAFGGKCLPEFEVAPPGWLAGREKGLGLRDLGDEVVLFPSNLERGEAGRPEGGNAKKRFTEFPECAPIGAGMILRRDAARLYSQEILARSRSRNEDDAVITDRKGDGLASGGDNDICLTVLEAGWGVGYFPELRLKHLIPQKRLTLAYHRRMARESMRSFVRMLDQHGIRPWPPMPRWTLPLRVAWDCLRVKPWLGPSESLTWWGHIGMYEGRSGLTSESNY